MSKKLTIGLFGFGCVGSGVYDLILQTNFKNVEIKKTVVKNPLKKRSPNSKNISFDASDILNDSEINLVVELINDSDEALIIIKEALSKGKHVVSANKKLIAENFDELIQLAKSNNVSFLYEAAVGGSIPIIRNLEEYYNNNSILSVSGILNGTTNYILTQTKNGISYADALLKAQDLGFAELNPTFDVDGFDSKFKLILLIKHGFGLTVDPSNLFNYGIRHIKNDDTSFAAKRGYTIKLIAQSRMIDNSVVGFVAPHFVDETDIRSKIENEYNAVFIETPYSDKQLLIGKGAGSYPTASAVLSDILAIQYDYQYDYRKTNNLNTFEYSDDYILKIFLSATNIKDLQKVSFIKIEDTFESSNYYSKIGWVKFEDIKKHDFNNLSNMFFAVMPEGVVNMDNMLAPEMAGTEAFAI